MTKRPSLKDQLSAQRVASASSQSSSIADTFRKDEAAEPTHRTSMYLPESLAKQLKLRAIDEGCSANRVVVNALEQYLNSENGGGHTAS